MIALYRRGRRWWARGTVHGKFLRVSLDTQIRDVAWQRLIDLELHEGRPPVRWLDFEKQYLEWKRSGVAESSHKKYRFVLSRFGGYLKSEGLSTIEDLTADVLASYPHVIDLGILHGAFSYALKCGYIAKNPVIAPARTNAAVATMPFTQEEIDRMLMSPYVLERPYRRAIVLTFLYTGLRISDVVALKKQDFASGIAIIKTQKRKKDVALALHPELLAAVKEHQRHLNEAQHFSPYLFSTATGKPFWRESMANTLRRIFEHAGIEHGHPHRFRDTFAVRLLSHGASPYDAAKLMGITIRVFEIHYAPYVAELRERAVRLVNSLDFVEGQRAAVQFLPKELSKVIEFPR